MRAPLVSVFLATLAACGGQQSPPAPIVVEPATAPAASASAAPAASRDDRAEAKGQISGDAIGDSFGASGVDLGDAGADAATATASGQRLGGVNRRSAGLPTPSLRQGATTVTGRLPPEVIQRIVRQNYGRFRLCYESGLARDKTLTGRVTTKLVIDASGAVKTTSDAGSDLPDAAVVACVARGFAGLSFPAPEKGEVIVTYPLIFSPGAPPAAPSAAP